MSRAWPPRTGTPHIIPILERTISATASSLQLAAMAAAYTTVAVHHLVDLSNVTEARISLRCATGSGIATAKLGLEYSVDGGSTWAGHLNGDAAGAFGASTPACSVETTANVATSWFTITPAARADVWLRVVYGGGNGVATAAIGSMNLEVRR